MAGAFLILFSSHVSDLHFLSIKKTPVVIVATNEPTIWVNTAIKTKTQIWSGCRSCPEIIILLRFIISSDPPRFVSKDKEISIWMGGVIRVVPCFLVTS